MLQSDTALLSILSLHKDTLSLIRQNLYIYVHVTISFQTPFAVEKKKATIPFLQLEFFSFPPSIYWPNLQHLIRTPEIDSRFHETFPPVTDPMKALSQIRHACYYPL